MRWFVRARDLLNRTRRRRVMKSFAAKEGSGVVDVIRKQRATSSQEEDVPTPDGRPSQDHRADCFGISQHFWPQLEDTLPIGTTPHSVNTLRAAIDTLLKGLQHWGDVLDHAIAAIDESRDDLPFIVVRQEDRERRGDAWEAYSLYPSLASQVGVAGRICGFPHCSYIDQAINDGRCGGVDPNAEAHVEMEETLLCLDGEGNFTGEEVREAIPVEAIRAKDLFARFNGRIGRQTGSVRQFWRIVTRLLSPRSRRAWIVL